MISGVITHTHLRYETWPDARKSPYITKPSADGISAGSQNI